MTRLSIAVVQGGPSSEASVSRASACGVAAALAAAGHTAVRLELDPWLAESLRTGAFDVVFPVTHGAVGEDGCLQGLLEVQRLPYVGSGVLASALAMDKVAARRLFVSEGLPVARGIAFERAPSGVAAVAAAERARRDIGGGLVVKPSSAGSAIGVTRLRDGATTDDVAHAIESVWALDRVALVEHLARGREVTCGILDAAAHGPAFALPPTEIASPDDPFYTYEARYTPGRSVHTCPADVGDALTTRIQQIALSAHRALDCRDLSRIDLIVGDGDDADAVTLLELNTLPGMTATSLYPEAAARAGFSFPTLCDLLARSAVARGVPLRNAALPMPA